MKQLFGGHAIIDLQSLQVTSVYNPSVGNDTLGEQLKNSFPLKEGKNSIATIIQIKGVVEV